jgi:ABC-type dipeptide/oligopeptide/nickel transport system permease component
MKTKKNSLLNKIASFLAFVIGAMAVFVGGKVLLGILPDYYVIDWLPVSSFFSSVVIWKNNKFAISATIGTFGLHALIMLVLQTDIARWLPQTASWQ